MKFTHLVQINDPLNPLIDLLTREQLWSGLKLRAEDPAQFVIGLDSFQLLSRSETELVRELHFGHLTVRDHVTFTPMSHVRYEVEAAGEVPAATLITTIEEPVPEQLFVRFEYDTKAVEGGRRWTRTTSSSSRMRTRRRISTPSAPSAAWSKKASSGRPRRLSPRIAQSAVCRSGIDSPAAPRHTAPAPVESSGFR